MGGMKDLFGDQPPPWAGRTKPDIRGALETGHVRAEQAADHAGEDWKDQAYAAFVAHARNNRLFTTEDVRIANPELPPPPDCRAWGQVALRASRDGIVKSAGQRRVASSHGMWKTLWEAI